MAIAVGILLLVVITVLFHIFSPWWFTPIAANWSEIDREEHLADDKNAHNYQFVTLNKM